MRKSIFSKDPDQLLRPYNLIRDSAIIVLYSTAHNNFKRTAKILIRFADAQYDQAYCIPIYQEDPFFCEAPFSCGEAH